jgi:predicted metalloprotease with PDZ domain
MLLDLEMLSRTEGAKSLLDVLSSLYHKFYETPPATYYAPGHGYTEQDILEALNEVAGSDFTPFFDSYVRGTAPLPYGRALGMAGLTLRITVPQGAPPRIGITTLPDIRGLRVFAVRPGGAADRAGLGRDDLLLAVDNQSLVEADLNESLKTYRPGASVPFTVERHGQRQIINVTLEPAIPDAYSIQELSDATPAQNALRERWLTGRN